MVAFGDAAGDEDARGDEGHVRSEGAEGDARHCEGPVAARWMLVFLSISAGVVIVRGSAEDVNGVQV